MTSTATRQAGPESPVQRVEPPIEPGRESKSGLSWLLQLPSVATRKLLRSVGTTPGRLSVIAVGLIALTVLTGVIGTIVVQDRSNKISELVDHREPLAAAAQQVYRSLSDADATSASAFLSTGTEPPALRQRYQEDIAQAGAALAKAASDSAGVADALSKVDRLSQDIPVYTGLVETARANNRQGFPAGASYLREASELMRAKILPAAQDLYRIDTDRLAEEQDDATGVPWLTTVLVLALLGALAATQVYLFRRTNRVLNVGLVVATAAMAVVLLWGAVAVTVQSVLVSSGQTDGTHRVDVLVRARIAALQARADETLTLVARGSGSRYEQDFRNLSAQLVGADGNTGLIGEAQGLAEGQDGAERIDSAMANATAWLKAHGEVRSKDDTGEYNDAVRQAIDPNEARSAAAAFIRLDQDLVAAIDVGRQNFLDDTVNGRRALILLPAGFAVLAVIAAAGVTMGIRERLREYR